jgi:hypothetical protein
VHACTAPHTRRRGKLFPRSSTLNETTFSVQTGGATAERTRAKRNKKFAAIVHPPSDNLRDYYAKSRKVQQTGEFLAGDR